jgi:2,3-bisphosphoglycerate-dependent phosphoglycerate mutase
MADPAAEGAGAERRLLYLFRHGETDWNREGRLQGSTDVPLNATGLAQAEALGKKLVGERIECVLSSDLLRAAMTARIVAESCGVPVFPEPGLRETQVGDAEGLLWEEARARFGSALTERWFIEDDVAFPGGETGRQTRLRGLAAIRRFVLAQPYLRIAVSTHGAMIRQLMRHALPPGSAPAPTRNTVLYLLDYEPASDRLAPALTLSRQ